VTTLVGTWSLARFILRRERLRLSVWVALLALVPVATASSFAQLYPDQASREALAATVASSPALTALLGPLYSSSIGGLVVWRSGTIVALIVALMAVLTMVRHTREEEETGRRELLGSTVVGHSAPLAAALLVTVGAGVAIALVLTLGLVGVGLPLAGSLAMGLAFAGVTVTFAGVGALAAQLTESAGAARGIGIGIAGFAFLLRMAGDAGGVDWLSWASPIGWVSKIRAFAGEEWWVLGLWAGLGAALITVSVLISSRRDVGAGVFPPRPGPAEAAAGLSGPFGLGWRLHRGALIGWTAGIATLGAVYGGAAESVRDMLEANPQLAEIFEQMGGEQGLTDTFFAAAIGIIAMITSAYAIRSVFRLRVEEEALRAEKVLATAQSRSRWTWSHLVYGLAGPAIVLLVAGAVAGATYGMMVGDVAGQAVRVLGAAIVNLPAVWVLTGVAMALFGLLPERTGLAWAVLVFSLIVGQLGRILQFPEWSINLSPFSHVPQFPAAEIEFLPMAVLLAIGFGLIALGLVGVNRRDIGK
jgi:ABC-2 type transport system permease protein